MINGEIIAGIAILVLVFGSAMLYTISSPTYERVRNDSFCEPAIFQRSVVAQSPTPPHHAGESGDDWGTNSASTDPSSPQTCSHAYLFGTDVVGDDIFDLMMRGAVKYLIPSVVVVVVVVVFGSLFGVLEGFYDEGLLPLGSWFFSNVLSAYPPIVLLIFVVLLGSGSSLAAIAVVYGLLEATRLGNSIVNKIKILKDQDFIASAREMGLSDWRIISRHILWYNCRELLLIHLIFSISSFIMIELYLGYLNVGNFQAWGHIIGPAARDFYLHKYRLLYPTAVVILTILGFYLIGDGFADLMNRKSEVSKTT